MKPCTAHPSWGVVVGVILAATWELTAVGAEDGRRVISLDGTWEIAQGSMETVPDRYEHKVPVPGLADMAQPGFAEVGVKSKLREAFWYRRTFRVEGSIPAVAVLKVHKAMFGTRIILNGTPPGEQTPRAHQPND